MANDSRKLLEQLMGREALYGAAPTTPKYTLKDPKICRAFVLGYCPHDTFTNTKGDIGPCHKIHSEALRSEYDRMSQKERDDLQFDWDLYLAIRPVIEKNDRDVSNGMKQLEPTGEELIKVAKLNDEIKELTENIKLYELEINIAVEKNQALYAYQEMHKATQLLVARMDKEAELKKLEENTGASGHQKLLVCDVCAAFLSRLDNDRRLADHFFGKVHIGYTQLREKYDELKKQWAGRAPPVRAWDRPAAPQSNGGYGGYGNGPRGDDGFRGGRRGGRGGGGYGGGRGGRGRPRW